MYSSSLLSEEQALQLLSIMAQLKTMLSSAKEVCPKLVPASFSVHAGTEPQVGSSAVGEFMVSESSSKFSHHRNPLLTHICAILRPASDRSDRELSGSIYTTATTAVSGEYGINTNPAIAREAQRVGEEGEWPRQLRDLLIKCISLSCPQQQVAMD